MKFCKQVPLAQLQAFTKFHVHLTLHLKEMIPARFNFALHKTQKSINFVCRIPLSLAFCSQMFTTSRPNKILVSLYTSTWRYGPSQIQSSFFLKLQTQKWFNFVSETMINLRFCTLVQLVQLQAFTKFQIQLILQLKKWSTQDSAFHSFKLKT